MKAVQREREEKLARKLKNILHQYVRGDKEGFLHHAENEAERLSRAGQSCNKNVCLTYKNSNLNLRPYFICVCVCVYFCNKIEAG